MSIALVRGFVRAPLAPLAWLLLAGALAGCGSAPPVEPPDFTFELPPEWQAPADSPDPAPALVGWWESFPDDRLQQIVGEALQSNLDLIAGAARVHAAAAEARIAGAEIYPWVGIGGNAARQQQVLILPGVDNPIRSTTYGVSLDVSWEIDLWGRLRNARSAAAADFQSIRADFEGARLSLTAQTLKAWFAALEAKRQLELTETTADSYANTVDRVRSRYLQGVRPSIDLRLTMVDQATVAAILEQRRIAYDRALRQLELLLGRYPGAKIEVEGGLTAPPTAIPDGLPADLLARRPDLVAAERRLAAANRRVAESKAALLPRLSLTASGGRVGGELDDLLDGDFSVWSLIGNLTQPIFQGGRLRAQVDRSRAFSEQAIAIYANQVLTACAEVEASLTAERYLADQEEAEAVAAEQALAAFELAQFRYESGLDDVITLLAAQRSAATAESRLLEVRRQRLDARVDLHLALGGGFELEEPETAASPGSASSTGSAPVIEFPSSPESPEESAP